MTPLMAASQVLSLPLKIYLTVNGDDIVIIHQPAIEQLPWADLNVDVVLECSGTFSDRETASNTLPVAPSACCFLNQRNQQSMPPLSTA